MTNIYLDIDGVLLTKRKNKPDHVLDLVEFLTSNFKCFWLTTHCRNGENGAVKYLSGFYNQEEIRFFERIAPAYWIDLKTEGIDFNISFIWLEDYPLESEIRILMEKGRLNSLITVNLERINELQNVLQEIKRII